MLSMSADVFGIQLSQSYTASFVYQCRLFYYGKLHILFRVKLN